MGGVLANPSSSAHARPAMLRTATAHTSAASNLLPFMPLSSSENGTDAFGRETYATFRSDVQTLRGRIVSELSNRVVPGAARSPCGPGRSRRTRICELVSTTGQHARPVDSRPPMRNFKAFAGLVLVAVFSSAAVARADADSITVGTTDRVVSLDPAGAYDLGSQQLIGNLYQNLLTIPAGRNPPRPDAARRCAFKRAKTYVCTLRRGLKFANGDRLTAADVKFSLDRVRRIADPV